MDYLTLKEQITNDIRQSPIANTNTKALRQMIEDGTVTYVDAAEYSKVLGDVVSKSITRYIADGIAEDELEAFAEECLAPVYRSSQDTMLSACKNVQRVLNRQNNIGLNPVEVERDEDRIQHIIDRFKSGETFEDLEFLTNANVAKAITRSAVNDSMKANASFHADAGLKETISRSDGSGCCDWCAGLVGDYSSYDVLPSDFWAVHRGCSCIINYLGDKVSYKTNADGSLTKITEV